MALRITARVPSLAATVLRAGSRCPAVGQLRHYSQEPLVTQQQIAQLDRDGMLIIESAFTPDDCMTLVKACQQILSKITPAEQYSVFTTVNQETDDYFLTSGDKIRYFMEEDAFDGSGKLQVEPQHAVNKIGHALHELDPAFKEFSHRPIFKKIADLLGYRRAVIAQSMYIFKNPRIGGLVRPHQDSTFLKTTPLSTLGFWIPMVDCTKTNGCLRYVPGSHRDGICQEMVRTEQDAGTTTKMIGKDLREYEENEWISAEIPQGSLVVIHGSVVHASTANRSNLSRPAYTFHIIEGAPDVQYSELNWLQPTTTLPFPEL